MTQKHSLREALQQQTNSVYSITEPIPVHINCPKEFVPVASALAHEITVLGGPTKYITAVADICDSLGYIPQKHPNLSVYRILIPAGNGRFLVIEIDATQAPQHNIYPSNNYTISLGVTIPREPTSGEFIIYDTTNMLQLDDVAFLTQRLDKIHTDPKYMHRKEFQALLPREILLM